MSIFDEGSSIGLPWVCGGVGSVGIVANGGRQVNGVNCAGHGEWFTVACRKLKFNFNVTYSSLPEYQLLILLDKCTMHEEKLMPQPYLPKCC